MSKILLIRHGQASFGAENYDCLSPLGERQAAYLGQYLRAQSVAAHHVIAGNMTRHQQTCDGVMNALTDKDTPVHIPAHIPAHIDAAWNEFDYRQVLGLVDPDFIDHSKLNAYFTQQPNAEAAFVAVFAKAIEKWITGQYDLASAPECESWVSFQTRVLQGLERAVAATPKGQNTLVFTSGGAITVVLLSLLSIPVERFLWINKELVNCGLTQLRVGKQGAVLFTMNEHHAMERASQEYGENFVSFK